MVFLANRENRQSRHLHDRITNRFRTVFDIVRRRRATPAEPGSYRVIADVTPRSFLTVDEYDTTDVRVEVGFRLAANGDHESYWFNWIEPDRQLLVGWHQDGTHSELGPVHRQVNHGDTAVEHQPAEFVDSHPLDVVERRLHSLPKLVLAVEWENGTPVGLDSPGDG